jgi:CspA family cold shock protein
VIPSPNLTLDFGGQIVPALPIAAKEPIWGKLKSHKAGAKPFAARSFFVAAQRTQAPSGSEMKEYIMPIGTVKFFDNAKGYGFITNEAGGADAFVHISAVEAAGMSSLEKEQRVSYELENDKRGKTSAVNLQSA